MSAYPASTAALLAPNAAFRTWASGSRVLLNVSLFLRARPPETIVLAVPRSGRSEVVNSVERCVVKETFPSTAGSSSTDTFEEESEVVDGNTGKAVPRTVIILSGISDPALTVAIAFPAYIGRVNVVSLVLGE